MDSTNLIERTWLEDIAFEQDAVMNICDLSGVLSHSQIFLAYLRISLWQNETGMQECSIPEKKVDV
jgi:hypothetical protein